MRAVSRAFFVASSGELGGLMCGARAHHDDRRTLEVPGCSSALCLGFSCCRGRARPVSSGAALQVRLSAACLRVACVSQSRHHAIEQAGCTVATCRVARCLGNHSRAVVAPACPSGSSGGRYRGFRICGVAVIGPAAPAWVHLNFQTAPEWQLY